MRFAALAFVVMAAAPVWAQTQTLYPDVGSTFVYDSVSTMNGTLMPPTEVRITIAAVQGDVVVAEYCIDANPCSYIVNREMMLTEFGYYGPPVARSARMIDEMREHDSAIPVIVTDRTGAPMPPVDGQTVSWTEEWRSDGFNEVYRMTLTQECCVEPETPAASGGDLWSMQYTFTASGGSGDGRVDMTFDQGHRWWIVRSSVQEMNGAVFHTEQQILREVIAP